MKRLMPALLMLLLGATVSEAAFAQSPQMPSTSVDAGKQPLWFVRLVSKHAGKDFCPPPSTPFRDLTATVQDPPISPDQLTDSVAIARLGTKYPCNTSSASTTSSKL
jgi:hypothetical protein